LLSDCKIREHGSGRKLETDLVQDLLRLAHHFPVLEQSQPNFFITQEKIRGNGEMRAKDNFLMDSIDPVIDRFMRRGKRHRLAFPIYLATGAHVDAGSRGVMTIMIPLY